MQYKLKNEEIASYNENNTYSFPKYTSQLINLANQNAKGTRKNVVGQMSDLFPEFLKQTQFVSFEYWKSFYLMSHPESIDTATNKIYDQVENLRSAIDLIDREMVHKWVEDLIYNKTYNGMYVQKAILASLAKERNVEYRLATPEEESKGIDGYVGDIPYSVKPDTYKTMERLPEFIEVRMIYYKKNKAGITFDVED